MPWFYLTLIFLAVALGVVAGYFLFVDLRQRDERRALRRVEEFRKDAPAAAAAPALFGSSPEFDFTALAPPGAAPAGGLFPALLRRDWLAPVRDSLGRSGLKLRLRNLIAGAAAAAAALGALGWWAQGPLLGLPAFLAGAFAPLFYVEHLARARRERFLAKLDGAFDLMARVIRSGQSIPQAFQAVGDAFDGPIAAAFTRCREQQNMGLTPDVAFQELAERSGVLEMRIFVMAMLIQRQAGGNLSEVLERLASLVRDRRRIRTQIRTLTAEGRLQATVLLVLPFFIFFAIRFVNRAYADELFRHQSLLAATGVMMGLGALWIRKVIDIDV